MARVSCRSTTSMASRARAMFFPRWVETSNEPPMVGAHLPARAVESSFSFFSKGSSKVRITEYGIRISKVRNFGTENGFIKVRNLKVRKILFFYLTIKVRNYFYGIFFSLWLPSSISCWLVGQTTSPVPLQCFSVKYLDTTYWKLFYLSLWSPSTSFLCNWAKPLPHYTNLLF